MLKKIQHCTKKYSIQCYKIFNTMPKNVQYYAKKMISKIVKMLNAVSNSQYSAKSVQYKDKNVPNNIIDTKTRIRL